MIKIIEANFAKNVILCFATDKLCYRKMRKSGSSYGKFLNNKCELLISNFYQKFNRIERIDLKI